MAMAILPPLIDPYDVLFPRITHRTFQLREYGLDKRSRILLYLYALKAPRINQPVKALLPPPPAGNS